MFAFHENKQVRFHGNPMISTILFFEKISSKMRKDNL